MRQIFVYFTVLVWASLSTIQPGLASETELRELAGTPRLKSTIAEMAPSDQAAALEKLMVQAQNGDARAQYVIGVYNAHGFVVPVDKKAAEAWFRMSAERSFAPGQETLGVLILLNSKGAEPELRKGYAWLQKAAN